MEWDSEVWCGARVKGMTAAAGLRVFIQRGVHKMFYHCTIFAGAAEGGPRPLA